MNIGRPSNISKEQQIQILDMYNNNKTIKSIANYFSCTTWTVRNELKKAGAKPRYKCKVCSEFLEGNRNTNFCSNHCLQTYRRKHKNCHICQVPLTRKDDNINIKYCDKCSSNLTNQTFSDIKAKRKRVLIEMKGGKCVDCGYKKCTNALEFHHRDKTTKLFNLAGSGISSRKWADVVAEVQKCDLVCSNCHREREESYFESLRKPIGERARDL